MPKSTTKYPKFLPDPKQTLPSKGSKLVKNDFKPVSVLGQGSFGKVYKVMHKINHEEYAIKVIGKSQISNLKMKDQLRNEINILQIVEHKNIVKMTTYFEDDANIYLIMELGGPHLYKILKNKGRFTEMEAAKYVYDAASAVAYLHERSPPIIHRDIKPENLLVCEGVLKMADFGWSNIKDRKRQTYCGTPDYLAPEMIDGSGHNEKLDVWSLGVLTYELLTGKAPFTPKKTKDRREKMRRLETNIMQVNFHLPSNVPSLAAKLIRKILRKDPKTRPTAREIMQDPWFISLGLYKPPSLSNNGLGSSTTSRRNGSQMNGSRRNYSMSRRNNSPMHKEKNRSVDFKKTSAQNMFNVIPPQNTDENLKFFTKKTVAKIPQDGFKSQVYSNSHSNLRKIATQNYKNITSNFQRPQSRDRSDGRRHQSPTIHTYQQGNKASYHQNQEQIIPNYGTPRRGNQSPSLRLRSQSKGNYPNASNGFIEHQRAVSREKTQIKNPPLPYGSTNNGYNQASPVNMAYYSNPDYGLNRTDSFSKRRKSGNVNPIKTQDQFIYKSSNTSFHDPKKSDKLTKSYLDGALDSKYSKTMNMTTQQDMMNSKKTAMHELGNLPNKIPKSVRAVQHKTKSSTNIGAYASAISSNDNQYNSKGFKKSNTLNMSQQMSPYADPMQNLKFYNQSSIITGKNSPQVSNISTNIEKNVEPEEETINWKQVYLEEKKLRQKIQGELEGKEEQLNKLNAKMLEEYKKSNNIFSISKGIENENSQLKNKLQESLAMIESLKSLNSARSNLDPEVDKLQSDHEKLQKTFLIFQKEVFSLAKKLKDMRPEWRPNTQNQKIFMKEVMKEVWKQLRTFKLEKEELESSKNFVSNKEFINSQFSEKKTIRNKRGDKDESGYRKNFNSSMMYLSEVIQNIDDINNSFDNSVKDDSGNLDSQRLFPDLILFFERIEKLRSQFEFKKLMKDFYS